MNNSVNSESTKKRLPGLQAFLVLVASPGVFLLYGREKTLFFIEKSLGYLWYSFLNLTIAYGYKPFRPLGWAMGLVTVGFFLFSSGHDGIVSRIAPSYLNAPAFLDNTFLANKWIPSEGEAIIYWMMNNGQAPQDYPKFNPLIYSLEAVFFVMPLGQLNKWHTNNYFLQCVSWLLTFIGGALQVILVLFSAGILPPKPEG